MGGVGVRSGGTRSERPEDPRGQRAHSPIPPTVQHLGKGSRVCTPTHPRRAQGR